MEQEGRARNIAAEFVGTTIVVLGGPGLMVLADQPDPLAVAIGTGIATAIAIGVIGAVANPMFSLALWFARAIPSRTLVADWVGQVLGGMFGAALIFGLNDTTRLAVGTNGWEPTDDIADGVELGLNVSGFAGMGVVLAAELLLGAIVVVVLLSSISQQRANAVMATFTGAAVSLATLLLLDVSGAGINPARSLGVAVFADTDPNALAQVWAFVLVPLVAAFAGTMIWLAIDDATIDDTVFDDTVLEDAIDAVTGD